MTPLRAKFIRDLVIRGRSKNTQKAYTRCVCDLARYYRRSPELISYVEVTGWLHHLIKERQLAASSIHIAVSAVRFWVKAAPLGQIWYVFSGILKAHIGTAEARYVFVGLQYLAHSLSEYGPYKDVGIQD